MRMDFSDAGGEMTLSLMQQVRLQVTDASLQVFQGLARRKNKFPAGCIMVMLFVPVGELVVTG